MARFRTLPLPEIHAAMDTIPDAHLAVEAVGSVVVDLYDGCIGASTIPTGRPTLCVPLASHSEDLEPC